MEKRLFIAVLISIAFLVVWSAIIPRFFPQLAKEKASPTAAASNAEKKAAGPAPTSTAPEITSATETADVDEAAPVETTLEEPVPESEAVSELSPVVAEHEQEIVVDHPRFVARFTNRGAQLVSFRLKNYSDPRTREPVDVVKARSAGQTDYPFAIRSASAAFDKEVNGALYVVSDQTEARGRIVSFTYRGASGSEVTKRFNFTDDEMMFGYSVHVDGTRGFSVVIGPGIGRHAADEESRFLVTGDGIVSVEGSFKVHQRAKLDEVKSFENADYIGLSDNYFVAVLKPSAAGEATFQPIEVAGPDPGKPDRELYAAVHAENGEARGMAYFGPKKADLLERYGLEATLQFGIFGFIARFLLAALIWMNRLTNNYGWAIIALTVVIKGVLFPLQHKSIVSMKKMQRVQPKVNAIRDKYKKAKSDPEQRQKMNTEMMKLYQKEGINPMSGCFPMLLQLPILWAFYTLLSHAIELRGAPWFGWIQDLSMKDPYYVTPIIMTITMFVQQWMTPTTADPTQRKMFLIMPIVFGWIFKEFPSGLVLYWLVQNLLTIVQQGIMNRWWKEHPESLEEGKTA